MWIYILDSDRFVFGEVMALLGLARRMNATIPGEEVSRVLTQIPGGLLCDVRRSYTSMLEKVVFPQSLVLAEGEGESGLGHDFRLKVTTEGGGAIQAIHPKQYGDLVPVGRGDGNRNNLPGLPRDASEMTAIDHLRTVNLAESSDESADPGKVIPLAPS